MFSLEVGVSQEELGRIRKNYEAPPYDLRFKEKVEKRLRGVGFKPYWEHGAITVNWFFKECIKDSEFIKTRVMQVLDAAEVPLEALTHIHVWGNGILSGDKRGYAGGSNLYMSSIHHTDESYIAIYPKDYPLGLDHVLEVFQIQAEIFTLLMTALNRNEVAGSLIKKKHNLAAGVAKLETIGGLLREAANPLSRLWIKAMSAGITEK